ncbi:MAG TPA: cobalt-precorrin-5B (C(1))-methyltransferase CbiD [Desulfobacterales bacterium]|nr:cobalt-precorrin-5B (C(1))-methyltransferase CbiD [Desulfobacterales bacterium]
MKKRILRTGFTTGTAAAAAAKGAVEFLLEGRPPQAVTVALLTGDRLAIPVHECRPSDGGAACTVIKDAGDDPDVTHGAEIGAVVRLHAPPASGEGSRVVIRGGEGVGRITKPGLELPPGEPAINPGPRRMIAQAVEEALAAHGSQRAVTIEIFVPRGREIARRTLNERLGILGGISILGTTGIVRPMSHEAFTATIAAGLSVARAAGLDRVVLTTGRRSERFAQRRWPQWPEEAFVQVGDFFQMSLELAARRGFTQVILAVFFGKALKMAQGAPHTHAARSELSLEALAQWALQLDGNKALAGRIGACHTAREAFELVAPSHPALLAAVGRRIVAAAGRFAGREVNIRSVIFDFAGNVAFDSEKQV